MAHKVKTLCYAAIMTATVACCLGKLHPGQHGNVNMPALGEKTVLPIEYGTKDEAIKPAVIGKVKPVFFERASKVVIQLVKDNLSKAKLGDLETYADGEDFPYGANCSIKAV